MKFTGPDDRESTLAIERERARRLLPRLQPEDVATEPSGFGLASLHERTGDTGAMPLFIDVKSQYLDRSRSGHTVRIPLGRAKRRVTGGGSVERFRDDHVQRSLGDRALHARRVVRFVEIYATIGLGMIRAVRLNEKLPPELGYPTRVGRRAAANREVIGWSGAHSAADSAAYAIAISAPSSALLFTSAMLAWRLRPPVISTMRASRNGVTSLPPIPRALMSSSA